MKFKKLKKTICASLAALTLGVPLKNRISGLTGAQYGAISFTAALGAPLLWVCGLVPTNKDYERVLIAVTAASLAAVSLGTGIAATAKAFGDID